MFTSKTLNSGAAETSSLRFGYKPNLPISKVFMEKFDKKTSHFSKILGNSPTF